jgi:hypothetical protein
MAIPKRHSSAENVVSGQRTFFVTTSTDKKRLLLQAERSAKLLIEVMFHYRDQGEYKLHDFVVMRNHFQAQGRQRNITILPPIRYSKAKAQRLKPESLKPRNGTAPLR